MEMGVEVDAMNGYMRGMVLPNARTTHAFVDSPPLNVDIDANERDFLVMRMKYMGQCDTAMLTLERASEHGSTTTAWMRAHESMSETVDIPFHPRSDSTEQELYFFPIWKHITGTIQRVRFYPCSRVRGNNAISTAGQGNGGQTFHLDWIAFAKAPVITKVRGCIDKYFDEDNVNGVMNCTTRTQTTNDFHHSWAFECSPMVLPIATTYNCMREGGERILIEGKHFGVSDAIVTVDGEECVDVVHVVPEVALECTLPPVNASWSSSPTAPSIVRVLNGRLHGLLDEGPHMSYVMPIQALKAPVISNIAAHAMDVNWAPPTSLWESMTVTGYLVQWKACDQIDFDPTVSVMVGNVTSTTIVGLQRHTAYHARVAAVTENYRYHSEWQSIDLYGRRMPLAGAVQGLDSPLSSCVSTLVNDFTFGVFTAASMTNVSAKSASVTAPTLGPTGEVGNQGHFGLIVNGDANIQNCNASRSCCDGFASNAPSTADAIAPCTFVCSVTENHVGVFINNRTARSVTSNSASAKPTPAVAVQTLADAAGDPIAPVTAACGPALRLTASASFLKGSAWYPRQMNIREGFETTFQFRISTPSTVCRFMDQVSTHCRSRGGDGFAFVVQNDHELALGLGGMELGYGGLKNALAIEFDTWYNYEQLDAYENHISIHISRKNDVVFGNHTYSLGSTTNIPDLTDGVHAVRIKYSPSIDEDLIFAEYFVTTTLSGDFFSRGDWSTGVGMLSVFLDGAMSPVLAVPLRVESSIELFHGRAWVGFTAATGASAYQTHDILSWTFESLRQEVPTPPAGDLDAALL